MMPDSSFSHPTSKNIGSAGEKLDAAYIAGSTANAGLMAFTRALGGASHADGVRVLGINPGPISTDRLTSLDTLRRVEDLQPDEQEEAVAAASG